MQIIPGMPQELVLQEIQQRVFIPHVNPFDDHMIHAQVHGEFMLDNYWQFVSFNNPIWLALLQNMMLHIQEHEQIIQAQQQAMWQRQVEAQMLIKGTTPSQLALRKASAGQNSSKG